MKLLALALLPFLILGVLVLGGIYDNPDGTDPMGANARKGNAPTTATHPPPDSGAVPFGVILDDGTPF